MKTEVIACDFDFTLAHYYEEDLGKPYTTKLPIRAMVNKAVFDVLKKYQIAGHKVIIHSSRSWEDYNVIQDWLITNHVPFNDIVLGKFKADMYIDDKAVNPNHENFKTVAEGLL